ncbi:MAG: HAD family phosphatase [Oscillospiraceae bacterium]|nr:HAD family phosphatase [Oscillospiraceae bacterium]
MLKLVIFDMDGVLVDSEPAITMASIDSLKESFGISAAHSDFKEFTGMGDDKFISGVAKKYGKEYDVKLKLRAYEIYMEKKHRVKVFPKAKKLLHNITGIGLSCAIASASDLVKVKVNIEKIKLGRSIGVIATGDAKKNAKHPLYVISGTDVKNKKPDPEIFLKAAETAGISPEYALVVEDAVSGVQAAKAAGMVCAAVTTSFSRKVLLEAGADFVVDKLYDVFDIVRSQLKTEN